MPRQLQYGIFQIHHNLESLEAPKPCTKLPPSRNFHISFDAFHMVGGFGLDSEEIPHFIDTPVLIFKFKII